MADVKDDESSEPLKVSTDTPAAAPETTAPGEVPSSAPAKIVSDGSNQDPSPTIHQSTTGDSAQRETTPPVKTPEPIPAAAKTSGLEVGAEAKSPAAEKPVVPSDQIKGPAKLVKGRPNESPPPSQAKKSSLWDGLIFLVWLALTLAEIALFAGFSDRSIPNRAWVGIGLASISGVVTLVISKLPLFRGKLIKELLRDIGIAFIVAVIVSIVYEFSTRTIGQQETVVEVINRMMGAFVPRRVWGEVTDEILHRPAIRSNVQVSFYIDREITLADGQHWKAPNGQVILKMVYSYQLNAMSQSAAKIPVEHELEYETWNSDLQLPKFIRVTVTGPGENESKVYEGASLQAISEGHRRIRLQGTNAVNAPGVEDSRHTRITTERLELINAPGAYDLIMPELTAEAGGSTAPTITIALEKIPSDLSFELETYYPSHSFERGPDHLWRFYRTMFPGQGFTVLLKRKEPPAVTSSNPTQLIK
jgi:hypothetical protein